MFPGVVVPRAQTVPPLIGDGARLQVELKCSKFLSVGDVGLKRELALDGVDEVPGVFVLVFIIAPEQFCVV